MSQRAKPFSSEGGRKWVVMWWLQGMGVLLMASLIVKALWLKKLDTSEMVAIYTIMGSLAGLFMGVQGAIDFRAVNTPAVAESNPPTDTPIDEPEEVDEP